MNLDTTKSVLLITIVLGGLGAVGPHPTSAQFTDGHAGTAAFQSAENSGNGGGNGNGNPYNNPNQIVGLNEPNSDVLIPSDLGTIEPNGNKDLSVTANSITSEVDLAGGNQDVDLEATGGDIDLSNRSITSNSNGVTMQAAGDIDLSGSTISAETGGITIISNGTITIDDATLTVSGNAGIELQAQKISAHSATLEPQNGGTTVSATRAGGGAINATGADMTGGNSGVTLNSDGPVNLNESTLTSKNGDASIDFGSESATLYVDGTNVEDSDGTLVVTPSTVDVFGSSKGSVVT